MVAAVADWRVEPAARSSRKTAGRLSLNFTPDPRHPGRAGRAARPAAAADRFRRRDRRRRRQRHRQARRQGRRLDRRQRRFGRRHGRHAQPRAPRHRARRRGLAGSRQGRGRAAPGRAHRRGNRMIEIKLTRLPHGDGLPLPKYATEDAAGWTCVGRGADARARRSGTRCRDRLRDRDPARLRSPGPAALRPRDQARHHLPQHARHDRQRLSRRSEGHPDQPRRRAVPGRAAASASPSWSRPRCCARISPKSKSLAETARGQRRLRLAPAR